MPLFWWALPWSDVSPGARGERVARWAVPAAEPLRGLLRGNAVSCPQTYPGSDPDHGDDGQCFLQSQWLSCDGLVLVGWCWQHHCTLIMESGSQVLLCPCDLIVHPVFFQARTEISCYWLIKAFVLKMSRSYNLSKIIPVWQTLSSSSLSFAVIFCKPGLECVS